jgi:hypothetical protein
MEKMRRNLHPPLAALPPQLPLACHGRHLVVAPAAAYVEQTSLEVLSEGDNGMKSEWREANTKQSVGWRTTIAAGLVFGIGRCDFQGIQSARRRGDRLRGFFFLVGVGLAP